MAVNGGSNQTAIVGTSVTSAPSVVITEANGNAVSGVSVTFSVTTGDGSLASNKAVKTDRNGIATSSAWTLGTEAGANTLTATATIGGASVTLSFTATGIIEVADSMAVNGKVIKEVEEVKEMLDEILHQEFQNTFLDYDDFTSEAANVTFLGKRGMEDNYFKRSYFRLQPVADITEHENFTTVSMRSSIPNPNGKSILNLEGKVILSAGLGKETQESVKLKLKQESILNENENIGVSLAVHLKDAQRKSASNEITDYQIGTFSISAYHSLSLNENHVLVSSILAKHQKINILKQSSGLRIEGKITQNPVAIGALLESRYEGWVENINYTSKISFNTTYTGNEKYKISAIENDFTAQFNSVSASETVHVPFIELGIINLSEDITYSLNGTGGCILKSLDEISEENCIYGATIAGTRYLNKSLQTKSSCGVFSRQNKNMWSCQVGLEISF